MRSASTAEFSWHWLPAGLLLCLWLYLPEGVWAVGDLALRKEDVVRWLPLLLVCAQSIRSIGRRGGPSGLLSIRWQWLDVPVIVYCLCPLLCGWMNDRPSGQALWETIKEFSYWFIPYLVGRSLAQHPAGTRDLAWLIVISAVLYAPLALIEVLRGPFFTEWVTGIRPAGQWIGAERGSTFRPSVFLPDGFVLTMYFALAALAACALAWQNVLAPRKQMALWAAAILCIVVVVAAKSLGSIVLLATGLAMLWSVRWAVQFAMQPLHIQRMRWVVMGLAAVGPGYMFMRLTGPLNTTSVYEVTSQVVSNSRAGSLAYRMQAEDIVFEQMAGHWWYGYGDYGLWQQDREVRALDGFWLFALTRTGLVSVAAWLAMIMLPMFYWAKAQPLHRSEAWRIECDWVWAIGLALYLVNSMFNYFGQPSEMLIVGVMTSLACYHVAPQTNQPPYRDQVRPDSAAIPRSMRVHYSERN